MATRDKTPTYNLKAVVRETGLKPDTLRAWERRYGVPTPQRTDSGHRLYSQHDIDTLKWLLERQSEGMSISRAIELWHRLEQEGRDPAAMIFAPGAQRSAEPGLSSGLADRALLGQNDVLAQLRAAWIGACLTFDEIRAEQLLSQAFALFPTEIVCLELIQHGLHEIGAGWYEGKVTVQQEHFASALAIRRMETLLAATPAPTRPGRILVACPPEEEHTFVPLLLSLLLRRRGWDVVYLGAKVPLRSLEATLGAVRPNLVILIAQQLYTAASLMEMAEVLLQERVPVAFGGLIFIEIPTLTQAIPGYYLGDHLESAVGGVEQIMMALRPQPALHPVGFDFREAAEHFRARQALIEAEIWASLQTAVSQRILALANATFSRNILAALTLGSMDYLDPDFEWIEGLLVNHNQLPADSLDRYLNTYYEAAVLHLEEPGFLVVEWLARLLGHELPREARHDLPVAGR